ncbi:MAG: BatD family protein [Aliidiomarina sp.]|uniref:BatD family protein n=1 Tax=Aliidiomarina sp. TaxID=1872439 RepID=UPI0025C4FBFF|nr:BatD family protein [Aliidiomarina sp.]MCH8502526.1 BatD family protein [Aliidiomarina sp.]
MRTVKFIFISWLIFLCSMSSTAFINNALAESLSVSANVDKNPVIAGESLTLVIRANERLPRNALTIPSDLGRLVLRNTGYQQSSSTINGQTQNTTEWRLTLLAREPGSTEIPAFDVAGMRTQPIRLEVLTPVDTGEAPDYFMTFELDTQSPYVQQQVRAQVKLHFAMNPEGGSVNFPAVEHLQIEQIGQDQQTQELIDGKRYLVITRNYAITPRRSGELTIPAIYFDGQIRRMPTTGFSALGRIEPVSMGTTAQTLNVRPRPAEFTGTWLPTPRLSLEEAWEPDTQRFTVGEPITRRITVTAAGVRPEQLPELEIDYPQGLRVYPDRGQSEQITARGTNLARTVFATAIVPASAGTYELPEVRIPWWNTDTDQAEVAVLPARTIEVINPPGGLQIPGSIQAEPAALPTADPAVSTLPTTMETVIVYRYGVWPWVSLVFALLWVSTLVFFFLKRQQQPSTPNKIPPAARKPLQALKTACMKNDPRAARLALLSWHKARTGQVARGVHDVAQQLHSDALQASVEDLERALYRADQSPWQGGKSLWQIIQSMHKNQAHNGQDDVTLPPLYHT